MVKSKKKYEGEDQQSFLKNEMRNKNPFVLQSKRYQKANNSFEKRRLFGSNKSKGLNFQKTDSIHPIFFSIYENNYIKLEQELLELSDTNINNIYYAGQSPLHCACLSKRIKTLKIILENGGKPNTVNSFGNTPLHIAVSENWLEGAEELLCNDASADTVTEDLMHVKELVRQNPLQMAVNNGNVKMVDMILNYNPNLTLTDGMKNNLLHMAACSRSTTLIKRFIDQEIAGMPLLQARNIDGNTPLHSLLKCDIEDISNEIEAATHQCTTLLVNGGAGVNTRNVFGETPLYLACRHNFYQSVDALLKAEADPTVLTKEGKSVVHASCMSECSRSLSLVLNTQLVNDLILAEDQDFETPFHKAVNSFSIDSCELLLNNGERLGNKDQKGVTRCSLVLKMPNAVELLTRVFDSHTKVSSKYIHSPSFKVIFDYSALMAKQDCSLQVSIISELNNERFKEVLKHPLLESFLYIKWCKMKPLCYLNVLQYTMFLLTHTTFLVLTYGQPVIFQWNQHYQHLLTMFRIFYGILFVLLFPHEAIAISVNFKKYLLEVETIFKFVNYTTAAYLIITVDQNLDSLLQRDLATISILCGWTLLMMCIGRFPTFGVYILMFLKISKSIIKFLISFSFLIVGFACSFLILFHSVVTFKNFPLTLVKTLMMMIGEIEYGELYHQGNLTTVFQEQKNHNLFFVYANDILKLLVISLFLFLVPVLMANLLVGLAVNDIPDLQRKGKILRLLKQADYIIGTEHFLVDLSNYRFFPNFILRTVTRYFSICKEVSVHPNKSVNISYDNLNIPEETLKEAIIIGAKIEEISAKENLCKSRINMVTHFKQFYKQYLRDTKEFKEGVNKSMNAQNVQNDSTATATLEAIKLLRTEIQEQKCQISHLTQQLDSVMKCINS